MQMLIASICVVLASTVFAQVNLDDVNAGCTPGGCSGHGVCVDAVCVCDSLWSSNADFIIVEDCTLSFIGIYVLWSVTLTISLYILYKTAWVVAARFENFFLQKKTIKGYTLWKNPGLISVVFLYGVGVPCVIIMAILHLVHPTTRIAFDTFTTIVFFFGKFGLYIGATFLQGPLLAVALRGEHIFDGLVQFNYRFNFFVNFLAILIGGIPFITLVNYELNIPKQFEVIRAYYFCQAIVLAMQFTEAILVRLRLNYVLKRATNLISSEKTSSILSKVNRVQDSIWRQAFLQCAVNVLMGAVPYLLNKHAYFLPLSWIAIPSIAQNVALQIELDKKGTKTIAQRLKMMIGGTSQTSNQDPTSPSSHPNSPANAASGKVAASEQALLSSLVTFESYNPLQKVKSAASQVESIDGMEDLLNGNSQENKKRFADFLSTRFASDSLNFYDAVTEYENSAKPSWKTKGPLIIGRFVADDSPEAMDFPHQIKEALVAVAQNGDYRQDTFAASKKIAFDLLKSNFYHKFTSLEV